MTKLSKNEVSDYKFNNLLRLMIYVAFVIIGFILYTKSYLKVSTVTNALGIIFIITGAVYVWMSSNEKKLSLSSLDVVFGILAALCGLLMMINPGNMVNNLSFYYGLFMIVCSLQKLTVAIKLYKKGDDAALLTFVTAALLATLGVLMLINPFGKMSISETCGVFAIFYGIVQLSNTVLLNNHEKQIIKNN